MYLNKYKENVIGIFQTVYPENVFSNDNFILTKMYHILGT